MNKRTFITSILLLNFIIIGMAQNFNSEADKLSYALGVIVGKNLQAQQIENLNLDEMTQALKDVMAHGDVKMSPSEAEGIMQAYAMKKQAEQAEKAESMGGENKAAGEAFLAENAKKEGVIVLDNGLQYEVLVAGPADGRKPKATETVEVHYHGTTIDGVVFDSSVDRGERIEFPLNRVIKGWTEILQHMTIGSKWRVYIPQDLAYGAAGAGRDIGPFSTLIFEIELFDIK